MRIRLLLFSMLFILECFALFERSVFVNGVSNNTIDGSCLKTQADINIKLRESSLVLRSMEVLFKRQTEEIERLNKENSQLRQTLTQIRSKKQQSEQCDRLKAENKELLSELNIIKLSIQENKEKAE